MIKKKKYIIIFFLLFIIGVIASLVIYSKKSTKNITKTFLLAETNSKDYVTTIADEYFARMVENKSGGKIKVKVYSDSELGDETTIASKIKDGSLAFGRISVAPLAEYVDEINVLLLPYLFESDDQMWDGLEGNLGSLLKEEMEEEDISFLAWYYSGSRSFYTKKNISKIDDLQNLKIRVQNSSLMYSMCETLGCIPSFADENLIADEVKIDTLDGAENNILIYYSYKQYEQCPYYIEDEHSRIPDVLIASKKILSDLTDEELMIIKECAKMAEIYEKNLWEKKEQEVKSFLKERNIKFIPVSPEEKSEMVNKFNILYDEFGNEYSDIISDIIINN